MTSGLEIQALCFGKDLEQEAFGFRGSKTRIVQPHQTSVPADNRRAAHRQNEIRRFAVDGYLEQIVYAHDVPLSRGPRGGPVIPFIPGAGGGL